LPLHELTIESEALRENPLGDPHVRPLWVWTPADWNGDGPAIYVLHGFTGQVEMWRNRVAFRRTFPELLEEEAPRCVVVFVDAFTSVGGSQYVDSNGSGRYHTYICEDVVPFVDARYTTNGLRGVAGKSSGGQGAAVTAMLRPDLFSGYASHAGGGLFDVSIRPFFRVAVRALRDHYDGRLDRFFAELRAGQAFRREEDAHILLQYGFSAAYSAGEDGSVRLPYDLRTGELIPELWARWLEWDTVLLVPRHADTLRSLRAAYVDCGTSDEWFVDLAAEALRRRLAEIGVSDLFFELSDDTHGSIDYRYPLGLRYLAERLSP
jgi:pimeloyl-ACP methyl ester carboxylesterase